MCKHNWTRTNGVTTTDGFDIYRCVKCGVTGKSFGLSGIDGIIEDSARGNANIKTRYESQNYHYRKLREHLKKLSKSNGLEWSRIEYEKKVSAKQAVEPTSAASQTNDLAGVSGGKQNDQRRSN